MLHIEVKEGDLVIKFGFNQPLNDPRGIAMIPLPNRGHTQDWRFTKKKVCQVMLWGSLGNTVLSVMPHVSCRKGFFPGRCTGELPRN